MSDIMFYGVLRMPYEMAMSDELSRRQFYSRAQDAADRVEAADKRIAELEATVKHHEAALYAGVADRTPAAPVVAEGLRKWLEAETASREAIEAYNAAVRESDRHIWPGIDINAEFQVMSKAKNKAFLAMHAMYDELIAAHPVAGSPAEAGHCVDCGFSVCRCTNAHGNAAAPMPASEAPKCEHFYSFNLCLKCHHMRTAAPVPASEAANWREAAQEFVDRVEKGEIRSKRTYAKFKALLAAPAAPTDAKPDDQAIRFRFFKLMSDAERKNVFKVFMGMSDKAADQATWHDVQRRLLAKMLSDLRANPAAQSVRDAAQPTLAAEEVRDALGKLAAYPLEEFGKENDHEGRKLFGANDWYLTVGDVRKARSAIASTTTTKG